MKYIAILLLLTSCYNQRKAAVQHGRAVTTFPSIGQEFCAITYPPRDSIIKGDTVMHFDTIYEGGMTYVDTVNIGDTIRIVKTIQLPGTVIKERYYIHDTLQVVNTAEVSLWQGESRKANDRADTVTIDRDKWRRIAKKRFWVIVGMGAAMALGLFVFIRRKIIKP